MPNLAREHPIEMADLLALSDYVDIRPSERVHFKRAVTVKLPLPPLNNDEFPEDDMVVMEFCAETASWQLADSIVKFTKSSVMFDTHTLGRCVHVGVRHHTSFSDATTQAFLIIWVVSTACPPLEHSNAKLSPTAWETIY